MFQFTHPGRGATRTLVSGSTAVVTVSIHAPREGCDDQDAEKICASAEFQFTHPGRGATEARALGGVKRKSFNSRTPGGVRPPAPAVGATMSNVSIHAPREGCDCNEHPDNLAQALFQFTHPGRGATGESRVSVRPSACFNSRTPGGVRPTDVSDVDAHGVVSIHAPREGCDS